MKKLHLTALAAFAIVALSPLMSSADELSNPAQGAVRRTYNVNATKGAGTHKDRFKKLANSIKSGEQVPYSTRVDTAQSFVTESSDNWEPDTGMWTGFLKRKASGDYTIVISTNGGNLWPAYSLWVNGRQIVDAATETTAVNVFLKAGYNDVCLIVEVNQNYYPTLTIKKKDSLQDPKTITPGDLWHEDEPDDEDED